MGAGVNDDQGVEQQWDEEGEQNGRFFPPPPPKPDSNEQQQQQPHRVVKAVVEGNHLPDGRPAPVQPTALVSPLQPPHQQIAAGAGKVGVEQKRHVKQPQADRANQHPLAPRRPIELVQRPQAGPQQPDNGGNDQDGIVVRQQPPSQKRRHQQQIPLFAILPVAVGVEQRQTAPQHDQALVLDDTAKGDGEAVDGKQQLGDEGDAAAKPAVGEGHNGHYGRHIRQQKR